MTVFPWLQVQQVPKILDHPTSSLISMILLVAFSWHDEGPLFQQMQVSMINFYHRSLALNGERSLTFGPILLLRAAISLCLSCLLPLQVIYQVMMFLDVNQDFLFRLEAAQDGN